MTNEQFLETVAKMRELQKQYFKTRDTSILDQCRFTEKLVDLHIHKVTNPQRSLFE
jgi:hypothetical protein